jgi:hypothetical protein
MITLNIIVIYVSSNIASYAEIEKKFIETLLTLAERIKEDINICAGDSD